MARFATPGKQNGCRAATTKPIALVAIQSAISKRGSPRVVECSCVRGTVLVLAENLRYLLAITECKMAYAMETRDCKPSASVLITI